MNIRSFFESHLGYDFEHVRIHNDSRADAATRELHARAFTWKNHIAFRAHEYALNQRAGQHLLAHELTHVIQQGAASQKKLDNEVKVAPTLKTQDPRLQFFCNFYVYDSTETDGIGTAWKYASRLRANTSLNGYSIGSGETIEYMLNRILKVIKEEAACDCVNEIQFWSHGSSGNAMSIKKTDDELTAADFDIPGLDKYGGPIKFDDFLITDPAWLPAKAKWFDSLSWRQQLLLEVRDSLCLPDATIYYRSCEAFKGKKGQEFAKKSATFWRSKVIGHTKIIGFPFQPGKKWLSPGEEPYWSLSEGETEMKAENSPKKEKGKKVGDIKKPKKAKTVEE
jgi:hypothetical protein